MQNENSNDMNENKNEIYELAKKAVVSNEKKKEKILDKLCDLVDKSFAENGGVSIDEASQLAYEREEFEVFQIISDEVETAIECLNFTKGKKTYDSNMSLLPFLIISKQEEIVLPSIQKFEDKIKEKLIQSGVCKNADFLKLGTTRIDYDTATDYELNDWWQIHREITEEDMTKGDLLSVKSSDDKIKLSSGLTAIFLFLNLTNESGTEEPDLSILWDSSNNFWEEIGNELSGKNFSINILQPESITTAIEDCEALLERCNFDLFWNEIVVGKDVEIVYAKQAEDSDNVCVLFVDAEDRSLTNFYVYETQGNDAEFINELIEKTAKTENKILWRLEEEVTEAQLSEWAKSENDLDMNKLISTASLIDLNESNIAYYGYNANPNKRFLH